MPGKKVAAKVKAPPVVKQKVKAPPAVKQKVKAPPAKQKTVKQRDAEIRSAEKSFIRDNKGKVPTQAELVKITGFDNGVIQRWRTKHPKKEGDKKQPKVANADGSLQEAEKHRSYVKIHLKNVGFTYMDRDVFASIAGINYGKLLKLQSEGACIQRDSLGNIHLFTALQDIRRLRKGGSDIDKERSYWEKEQVKTKVLQAKGMLISRPIMNLLLTKVARTAGNTLAGFEETLIKQLPQSLTEEQELNIIKIINSNTRGLRRTLKSIGELPEDAAFDDELEPTNNEDDG